MFIQSTNHKTNQWRALPLFKYLLCLSIILSTSSDSSSLSLSVFLPGLALIDASEAMKELGEVKDALDMEVKQNFIDPLQNLHDKDLKEIQVNTLKKKTHLLLNSFIYRILSYYIFPSAAAPSEEDGGPPSGL